MNNGNDDISRILYKEELINKLFNEVDRLEYLVNNYKCLKFRKKLKKKLKVFSKMVKLIAPYIAAITVISGIYTEKHEDNKLYLYTLMELDEDKNITYLETKYGEFANQVSKLSYYSKWRLNEDGSYTRDVLIYDISNLSYEKLLDLYERKDSVDLVKLFGDPIIKYDETFLYLSSWEIVRDSFFEAVIYVKDKNEYIILEEDKNEDVLLFLITVLLLIGSFTGISVFYGAEVFKEIEKTYNDMVSSSDDLESLDVLKKKLKISKNNYDRVMRDE